jgi:hypothetical protein
MSKGESHVTERYFPSEDVWVTVPTQARARTLVISESLGIKPLADTPATPNVFEPIRTVINFEVREEDGTVVHRLSPPMILRVAFTEQDLEQVGEGNELGMAFWDGSRWVPFTKEEHHFQLHSRFAVAVIREWGDPSVGLGRR